MLLRSYTLAAYTLVLWVMLFFGIRPTSAELKVRFPPINWLQAWTFIDKNGRPVSDKRFDAPSEYIHGYAVVSVAQKDFPNGKFIVDMKGTPLVPYVFSNISPLSNGLFVVSGPVKRLTQFSSSHSALTMELPEGKQTFLSASGKLWTKKYDACGSFSDGVAIVHNYSIGADQIDHGGYHLVDTGGRLIKELNYVPTGSLNFIDSMLPAKPGDSSSNLAGFLNTHGRFVVPIFKITGTFCNEFARAETSHGWIFINRSGKEAFARYFQAASDFHEGLARVRFDNRDGFIDKSGHVKIKASQEAEHYGDFSEGLAPFSNGSVTGFINKCGFVVSKESVILNTDYHDGLRREANSKNINARIGYLDVRGVWKIRPRFIEGKDFSEGLASVRIHRALTKKEMTLVKSDEESAKSAKAHAAKQGILF